jgi:hypothetical protein
VSYAAAAMTVIFEPSRRSSTTASVEANDPIAHAQPGGVRRTTRIDLGDRDDAVADAVE